MRWIHTVRFRLRSLFRRRQVEEEIDEELRDHLQRETDEFVARGMDPKNARDAALRAEERPPESGSPYSPAAVGLHTTPGFLPGAVVTTGGDSAVPPIGYLGRGSIHL
jgi:hypothetical protein